MNHLIIKVSPSSKHAGGTDTFLSFPFTKTLFHHRCQGKGLGKGMDVCHDVCV